jgi:5'-deoxynucleotidase YfbR-like HD superfamily hydrolase
MNSSVMDSVLPFLHIIERLKNLPRSGWVLKGVQGPESVQRSHVAHGNNLYAFAQSMVFHAIETKVATLTLA